MMIGDMWGCNAGDWNNKTPCRILRCLLSRVAQGGNLLLNVGPEVRPPVGVIGATAERPRSAPRASTDNRNTFCYRAPQGIR